MGRQARDRKQRRGGRIAVGGLLTAGLTSGLALANAGTAQAAQTYVTCPVALPGVGCGFEGAVGPGSYIVTYRFRRMSGGYGAETQAFTCPKEVCPVFHYAVQDPNRIPAGFDISSDAMFTSFGEFS